LAGTPAYAAQPAAAAALGTAALAGLFTLQPGQQVTLSCNSKSAATGKWAADGRLLELLVQEVVGSGANAQVFKVQLLNHSKMAASAGSAAAAGGGALLAPSPAAGDGAAAAGTGDDAAAGWWAQLDTFKAAAAAAAAEPAPACSYQPPQHFALKVPLGYHLTPADVQQALTPAAYYQGMYNMLQHEQQLLARMASCYYVIRSYAYGTVQYGSNSCQRLPCLLMELATGTVEDLLEDCQAAAAAAAAGQPHGPVSLSSDQVWAITRDVSGALFDLHEAGIAWKDLKPSNILVVKRGSGKWYALCDFGISVVVGADGLEETAAVAGTPSFMAPELKYGRRVGLACDVWSLGILLLTLCSGQHVRLLPDAEPSNAAASWDAAAVLSHFEGVLLPTQMEFVHSCLTYDASMRADAEDMRSHVYVAGAPPGAPPPPNMSEAMAAFRTLMGQAEAAKAAGSG
jgi:serine/threonine protein kinase